jgi:hypothetical protein
MSDGTRPSRTLALLAPALASVPPVFERVDSDGRKFGEMLEKLQRLRGSIYLADGAIEPWQLTDGRHCTSADDKSWHFLSMEGDQVVGCARLQEYAPTVAFSDLVVAQSTEAQCPEWGLLLRRSVTAELRRADVENLRFIEAGGWALAPELRFTTEALQLALGSYAIGELLGGSLGVTTATVRHRSSSILRRLGGASLMWDSEVVPPYYDVAYGCEMEVLRFDSRQPNPKYQGIVDQIKSDLPLVQVFCRAEESDAMSHASFRAENKSGSLEDEQIFNRSLRWSPAKRDLPEKQPEPGQPLQVGH